MVSPELWVGTLERWVSGGLWLLDTVSFKVSDRTIVPIVSLRPWQEFCSTGHQGRFEIEGLRTRYGEPSSTDYAGKSSWILSCISIDPSFVSPIRTGHCDDLCVCRRPSIMAWTNFDFALGCAISAQPRHVTYFASIHGW